MKRVNELICVCVLPCQSPRGKSERNSHWPGPVPVWVPALWVLLNHTSGIKTSKEWRESEREREEERKKKRGKDKSLRDTKEKALALFQLELTTSPAPECPWQQTRKQRRRKGERETKDKRHTYRGAKVQNIYISAKNTSQKKQKQNQYILKN